MSDIPQEMGAGPPGLRRLRHLFTKGTPKRRVLLALGAITFVVGAVLLSIGLFSLVGGGGSRAQPAIIDLGIQDGIFDEQPRLAPPRSVGPTPPPAPPLGDQPYQFVIEKLGVAAPVRTYGLDASAVPIVPTGGDAAQIVAWYDFSAKPGTGGNAVFAGHVTWNGAAVFYKLTSMAEGDLIKLRGQDGAELVYRISAVFSVDPNDPDSLKVMQSTDPPRDVLTIITCDGAFVDTNDPVFGGEYSSRLVVRGDLQSVVPPGAPPPAAGG